MSVCGDRGRSMKLALHRAGDHGGNAFPISSSSCSSSSSSSCLGESSPESLRSLSCRSGGPPVYDVLEVTLAADVVLSGWSPEEDGRHGDGDEEVSTGRERPPSGDTSLSVYLDADGPGEPGDPWNQNLTLALKTQDGSHGNGGGVSSERRRGSSTPDSDSTEIPADEEDEGLFVSVSSDLSGRPEQDRAGPARLPQSGPQRSGGPEDHSVASWAPPEEPGSGPGSGSDPAPRPGSDPSGSSAVATPIRDAKRVPKPDMKAVQARGGTRGHAPRLNTPPQVRAVRTALGPSPGPVKVAVLRRPVRGRSGPAPPRKGAVLGRALSDGAGGSVHARGKAVHDAGEEVTRPAREEKGGAAGGPAGVLQVDQDQVLVGTGVSRIRGYKFHQELRTRN